MDCPEHHALSVGCCRTCGRDVCELCLAGLADLDAFECPGCGERGALRYDADYGGLVEGRDGGESDPDL